MIAHSVRRLVVNPLIVKDGLDRTRTWRTPLAIGVYLLGLGVIGGLALQVQLATSAKAWGGAGAGSGTFTTMALTQLALLCLIAPGVGAGAISGERERQTLDMLMVSGVTPVAIVWGKLVASLAFLFLLVVAALPLFATVFLFGGIDIGQLVAAEVLTLATASAIGAAAIFLSAVSRRSLAATVSAYAVAFLGIIGGYILSLMLQAFESAAAIARGVPVTPHRALLLSPLNAMLDIVQPSTSSPGPAAVQVTTVSGGVATAAATGASAATSPLFSLWQVMVVGELAIVFLCVAAAALVLRGRRPLFVYETGPAAVEPEALATPVRQEP